MNYFDKNQMLSTFLPAVRSLLVAPKQFFTEMPTAAFYGNAFFYTTFLVFIASFVGVPFYQWTLLFMVPVSWGVTLLLTWLWGKYIAWAVRTLAKKKLGPANAFQMVSYASTPAMVIYIPVASMVGSAWGLYLLWTALVERLKVSAAMAAMIIAVPALSTYAVGYVVHMVIVAIFFSAPAAAPVAAGY